MSININDSHLHLKEMPNDEARSHQENSLHYNNPLIREINPEIRSKEAEDESSRMQNQVEINSLGRPSLNGSQQSQVPQENEVDEFIRLHNFEEDEVRTFLTNMRLAFPQEVCLRFFYLHKSYNVTEKDFHKYFHLPVHTRNYLTSIPVGDIVKELDDLFKCSAGEIRTKIPGVGFWEARKIYYIFHKKVTIVKLAGCAASIASIVLTIIQVADKFREYSQVFDWIGPTQEKDCGKIYSSNTTSITETEREIFGGNQESSMIKNIKTYEISLLFINLCSTLMNISQLIWDSRRRRTNYNEEESKCCRIFRTFCKNIYLLSLLFLVLYIIISIIIIDYVDEFKFRINDTIVFFKEEYFYQVIELFVDFQDQIHLVQDSRKLEII